MHIKFSVPGHIVPWARAGGHGAVRFTPAPQRSFAATIKTLAADAMQGRPPIEGPVELRILAVWPWPKSMSARKRALPCAACKTSKPDSDNVGKIVKDALNKIAFLDDAQVSDDHIWKRYGDRPGLTVEVRGLP